MQNSFSYEKFHTWTRFEKEAQENSERAYCMASGRRVVQLPDYHTFLCKFLHFQMAVSCLLLGYFQTWGFCKAWSALNDYVDR